MSARLLPPPVAAGSRIAVVAPAGPLDAAVLKGGLRWLRDRGFEVVLGAHLHDRHVGYLAGPDEGRAADLTAAWLDPGVDAVVCARGGYGATRLLDLLDWTALAAAPAKALVGASDVTALHAAFGDRLGIQTYFGPMPGNDAFAANADDLLAVLGGGEVVIAAGHPLVPGRAEGRLTGGTLALLSALAGTPYASSAAGCVAFLEDVGEPAYRLDRMLTQLVQSGYFAGVRGVALGTWHGCAPDALDVLARGLAPLGVPVLAGLPVGHGPVQRTLPLGAVVRLDAAAGTLRVPR